MKAVSTPISAERKPSLRSKAVLYYCKTTEEAGWEAEQTNDDQRRIARTAVADRNLTIFGEFCDKGVASSLNERPGFYSALSMIEAGLATVMIVPSLAVFGRSATTLVYVLAVLDKHKARLVVVEEDIDTASSAGRLYQLTMIDNKSLEREHLQQQAERGEF